MRKFNGDRESYNRYERENFENNFDNQYDSREYDDYRGDDFMGEYDRNYYPRSENYFENSKKSAKNTRKYNYDDFQKVVADGNGTNNVIVAHPKNYADVQRLIDSLRNKQAIIVHIDNLSLEIAQRVLDFLSGAIYALGGSQQQISQTIYLLTPGGTSIKIPYEIIKEEDED